MTVSFRTRDRDIDLGVTLVVLRAFGEMAELTSVEDYLQLMYVPWAGDEEWPEDMATRVRAQARDMLARHGDRLSHIALEILEDLIRSGEPA